MEPNRDDQLIADLQALRPTPRPQFAAELDERAAAGFPRRSRLRLSLPTLPVRHMLNPIGGVALLAIGIATAVIATSDSGHRNGSGGEVAALLPEERHQAAPQKSPSVPPAPAVHGGSEVVYGTEQTSLPSQAAEGESQVYNSAAGSVAPVHQRAVERSAEVVLAAQPEDVADDASKVFEAVHAHNGIVIRSSTQEGAAGEAGATFDLLIPSGKLGDAMAAFSRIDEVRSRHEGTADITAPTVTATELLKESRARVDSLLAQLEAADAEEEQEAIEAELRHERRNASRIATQLTHLHKRADLSRVSLRIETGSGSESSGGAWGIDDALHDAGHVLTIAAAVTLVTLAILGPVALIALLAWLTHRAWVRRERRRVLS
jgi:hypothetical protein